MTQKRRQPQNTDDNLIGLDGELNTPVDALTSMVDSTKHTDKKQDHFRPDFSAYKFTSSLYIDQAIEALRENALKTNNERKDLLIIKCDVVRVDFDRARFKLESERMGKITFMLVGTMQR